MYCGRRKLVGGRENLASYSPEPRSVIIGWGGDHAETTKHNQVSSKKSLFIKFFKETQIPFMAIE